MSKHTKGPWHVGGPNKYLNQLTIEPSIGVAYGAGEELYANANVMAAGPDLLEALEALSPALGFEEAIGRDEGFIVWGDNPALMAAFKLAANAIKKARGEA